jgi:hypothetical protein
MISELLESLMPDEYLQMRDAFENEYTAKFDVEYKGKHYWVGVNIPAEVTTTAREGLYAYGEKP